jgi:hypothetical protein
LGQPHAVSQRRPRIQTAIGLLEEEIAALLKDARSGVRRKLLQEMQGALAGIESINVCVCSFSERGDLLSQWR